MAVQFDELKIFLLERVRIHVERETPRYSAKAERLASSSAPTKYSNSRGEVVTANPYVISSLSVLVIPTVKISQVLSYGSMNSKTGSPRRQ